MATRMLVQLTEGKKGEYSKLDIKKNPNATRIGVLKLDFKYEGGYLEKKNSSAKF